MLKLFNQRTIQKAAMTMLLACAVSHMHAQLIAAKTNALLWGNLTPIFRSNWSLPKRPA